MLPSVLPPTTVCSVPQFPVPFLHPARFPLQLPTFFVRLMTQPGHLVFDPFAGTCTTAVAAENLGRRWLCTEVDPTYAAVLPDRILTGR